MYLFLRIVILAVVCSFYNGIIAMYMEGLGGLRGLKGRRDWRDS